ncbi:hypothetical protein [Eubacterium sp. CAG:161]|uniref:hypothetical protein n=1 Tax=Eubacterium sp. CAG:161 TaxID=1262881 RepID=UPI002672A301|nr:hypothetical protein [Eubacterium sp. CAG:161]
MALLLGRAFSSGKRWQNDNGMCTGYALGKMEIDTFLIFVKVFVDIKDFSIAIRKSAPCSA